MPTTNIPIGLPPSQQFDEASRRTRNVIAWSSLLFAALQSICIFFAAVDGLRVGIGISSLVLAASTAATIDRFHVDWLRVPMISLALLGSILNLAVLWQIRRLRKSPAAKWRQNAAKLGQAANGAHAIGFVHRDSHSVGTGRAAAYDLAAPPIEGFVCILSMCAPVSINRKQPKPGLLPTVLDST